MPEADDPVMAGAQLAGRVVNVVVLPLAMKPDGYTVDVLVGSVELVIDLSVPVGPASDLWRY